MSELRTITDVHCLDTDCPQATLCTECNAFLCPEHSNEFTTCTGYGYDSQILHHVSCADHCLECAGARAQDAAEASLEAQREDDRR